MAREVIDIIIQERGSTRVVQAIEGVGAAADRTQRRVSLLQHGLSALGVGFAVREVLRATDAYARMENQLKILGYSQDQVAGGMEKLFNIAQRARAPYEQIVALYGKLGQAAGELGKSEAEMLRFTELAGKALAVQGVSGNAARGVLTQLTQAMGEGIVRAQEWNSMVENARPLLLAAAKGLDEAGGSVSKLRQIMLDGRLTSTMFFDAVMKGGDSLDEQFNRSSITIAQAMTKVQNAWERFLGVSGTAPAISYVIGTALGFIADNFEVIATAAMVAGVAFATWWGVSKIQAFSAIVMGAVRAQTALNIALGATGFSATIAGGALKFVQVAVRGLTAAIAANPLGLLLVAAIALAGWLYTLRDSMISFGGTAASVGSVVQVLWQKLVAGAKAAWDYVVSFFQWFVDAGASLATSIGEYFANIGVSGRDMANFLIAVIVSFKDIWVGQFRILYQVAIAVFQGVADAGRAIMDGLGAAISGDFEAAGAAFSKAFSGETFNFDGVVAEAEGVAGKIGSNFGRDFIGEAGGAIQRGKQYIADTMEGVMTEAAALDSIKNQPAQEFEFAGGSSGGPGAGAGGAGGAAKKTKDELTGLQQALKDVEELTVGALQKLQDEYGALNAALQAGTITQSQYMVKMQDLRVRAAELAFESANVAKAVHDANIAILQLKIDAGTGTFGDAFLLQLNKITDGIVNFRARAGTIFGDFFAQVTDGFANSIGRAIVYSEDLGEALSNVAKEALASLISGLVKLGIQWLLNAAIGKSIGVAATAATAAQAGASAAMWAPAAALASLATSGANAAAANAGIAGTMAMTKTLAAAGAAFKDGGMVKAPGGPRDDKGLAALSNGEFVINAASTRKFRPLLEAINSGRSLGGVLPMYRDGGEYTGAPQAATPGMQKQVQNDVNTTERAAQAGARGDAPSVAVPVTVVNVVDPKEALNALQSNDGSRIIWNQLEKNPGKLKQLVGAR